MWCASRVLTPPTPHTPHIRSMQQCNNASILHVPCPWHASQHTGTRTPAVFIMLYIRQGTRHSENTGTTHGICTEVSHPWSGASSPLVSGGHLGWARQRQRSSPTTCKSRCTRWCFNGACAYGHTGIRPWHPESRQAARWWSSVAQGRTSQGQEARPAGAAHTTEGKYLAYCCYHIWASRHTKQTALWYGCDRAMGVIARAAPGFCHALQPSVDHPHTSTHVRVRQAYHGNLFLPGGKHRPGFTVGSRGGRRRAVEPTLPRMDPTYSCTSPTRGLRPVDSFA